MPRKNTPTPKAVELPERTEAITVGPDQTPGLIGAWQGIFNAFHGTVEKWEPTPDGLVAHNLTVDGQYADVIDQLLIDINLSDRRTPLYPFINYIFGLDPEPFLDDKAMTLWLVTNFRNSVEANSSRAPKYARDAIQNLKAELGTQRPRGPKPKSIFKNIAAYTAEALEAGEISDLENLIANSQAALAAKTAKTVVNA